MTYLLEHISLILGHTLQFIDAVGIPALVCSDEGEVGLCQLPERPHDHLGRVFGYGRGLAISEELDEDELFVCIHVDGTRGDCGAGDALLVVDMYAERKCK